MDYAFTVMASHDISCAPDLSNPLIPTAEDTHSQIKVLPRPYWGTGEHRLFFGVLENALSDLEGLGSDEYRKHRLGKEAFAWVWSNATDWPCSFINICDHLGLDPDYLRGCIARGVSVPQRHAVTRHKTAAVNTLRLQQ